MLQVHKQRSKILKSWLKTCYKYIRSKMLKNVKIFVKKKNRYDKKVTQNIFHNMFN